MEVKDLGKIVLLIVLVGMIMGVGILVFDKFGLAVRDITAVTNESVTFVNGTGTVANIPIYSVTSFSNGTTTYSNISTDPTVNYTASTGVFVIDTTRWFVNGTGYIYYSYYANSTATDVIVDSREAIEPISSSWLPILITVIVLGIIMGMVINSFGNRR